MKGTTVGVDVAVEDNKTRPVVSCNSSPYMYGSTRDVLLSVLTFPFPSESCPVDDSPSSAGPDVEWLTWTLLSSPGLGKSLTLPVWWTRCSRRVTVDTLQPNVAAMFCLV